MPDEDAQLTESPEPSVKTMWVYRDGQAQIRFSMDPPHPKVSDGPLDIGDIADLAKSVQLGGYAIEFNPPPGVDGESPDTLDITYVSRRLGRGSV